MTENAATRADVQTGLAELRAEMATKADMKAAEKATEAAIERVKSELTWRMALAVPGFATVVIAAIKLIP